MKQTSTQGQNTWAWWWDLLSLSLFSYDTSETPHSEYSPGKCAHLSPCLKQLLHLLVIHDSRLLAKPAIWPFIKNINIFMPGLKTHVENPEAPWGSCHKTVDVWPLHILFKPCCQAPLFGITGHIYIAPFLFSVSVIKLCGETSTGTCGWQPAYYKAHSYI